MRTRARILAATTFASVSLLAFGYGVALAQNTPPAAGAKAAPVTGTLGGNVNLSPDEISKQAEGSISRMEMYAMQVQRMLDKADQDGDATKVDCLNNELNVIDTRFRAARDRKPLLDNALRSKDLGQATVFLQVIQNHQDECANARSRADNCIGTDVGFIGESKTSSSTDPDIPEDSGQPPALLNSPNWGLDLPPGTDPSASL